MRRFFYSILFAVISLATASARTDIHVARPGTLPSLLTETDQLLGLTGSINGTDIKFLREKIAAGTVTQLDLSGVRIVAGGTAYNENYTTSNDVLGNYMFADLGKLTAVTLPNTVKSIGRYAFSKTGIKEVDIPGSVTLLDGACFADCYSLTKVVIGSRVAKLEQAVFYNSSNIRNVFLKPKTPPQLAAYIFTASPTIRVFTSVLDEYKASDWKQYGTLVAGLENYYEENEGDGSAVVSKLTAGYFEDAACTTLKEEYTNMSDEDLIGDLRLKIEEQTGETLDDETFDLQFSLFKDILLKVKNNSWAPYEKDFRIHSYKAYSDASYWNSKLKATGGSFMGNPTGIYTHDDSPLYVFVDNDIPAGATLYIAGVVGNDLVTSAKQGKMLGKGMNVVDGREGALFYIIYTANTKAMTATLEEWPAMKIHIEGGKVNGYYDASHHSDAEYEAILSAATHERFTVKGSYALFNFKTSTYRKVWPQTIDKSIAWYDSLTVWEKELMGICESVASGQRAGAPFYLSGGEAYFPKYYNNPNFAIEGEQSDGGFANSASFRTMYNTMGCVQSSFDVSRTEDFDDWCCAHESGHNNQGAITVEGGTEVSNNLFSNYIRFHDGLVTTNGSPLATIMNEYARHEPFFTRPLDSQMRMYWQLYLYYHLAQRNTSFYPELFKALRKDPLTLYGSNTGCLKFVRKVCEIAGEDLTEFFRIWGFFEPLTNYIVNDYGEHQMTVKQYDINRTLKEIAKYPVKNREILFIEDRIDYVPTTDFLTSAGQHRRESERVGQCGDVGQYTDYLPGACLPSSYTYLQADSLYALDGEGGLGFVALDQNHELAYASNSKSFCIPSSVGKGLKLYSLDSDGSLHEIVKKAGGAEYVEMPNSGVLAELLSPDALKVTISGYINSTDVGYMRQLIAEHNLQSIDLTSAKVIGGGQAYYQNYKTSINNLGPYAFDSFKKLISMRLPLRITSIADRAFRFSGLRMIEVPDAVTSIGLEAFGGCEQLSTVIIGKKVASLAQGVFYNSPVRDVYVKAFTPPTLSAYIFNSHPTIHVYANALAKYQASKWAEFGTIVGDLDNDFIDGIMEMKAEKSETNNEDDAIYDLSGRKMAGGKSSNGNLPRGIYIQNGKKVMVE